MAAKLTYQDVFNDELAPEKFLSSPLYFSTGAINPSYSAPCGSIYVNTMTGGFFLNTSSPTPGTTWLELSDNFVNIEIGHHRAAKETSLIVTSSGQYTPTAGDLVGTFGLGAWTNGNTLNHTYVLNNGCGSRYQALNAGGNGTTHNFVEYFNGSSWSNTGSLGSDRYNPVDGGGVGRSLGANLFGSTNSAVCVGGYTGSAGLSSCELYTGSLWLTCSANVPGAGGGISGMAAGGTSFSGFICGQDFGFGFRTGVTFNGSVWTSGGFAFPYAGVINGDSELSASGSINSALIHSYLISGAYAPVAYTYNGSNAYVLTTIYNYSFINAYLSGNPLMGYKYGGRDTAATPVGTKKTEIFNGVTFNSHVDLNTARIAAQTKGPGSAVDCIAMGGRASGEPGTVITGLNSSEIYTETITYKKLYPQYIKSYNKASIYLGSNSSFLKGYQTGITYPPNKYLVVNKNAITAIANESDISGGYSVLQVGVTGALATYSIGAAPSLQIIPGTIAYIVASGANPLTANNVGIFVVKNIIVSSNTVVVTNPAATNQNPGTGHINFVTTMICVDYVAPDDILIGSTDNNGYLTTDKLFQTTNYFSKTGF